jgi:hypothetical protein
MRKSKHEYFLWQDLSIGTTHLDLCTTFNLSLFPPKNVGICDNFLMVTTWAFILHLSVSCNKTILQFYWYQDAWTRTLTWPTAHLFTTRIPQCSTRNLTRIPEGYQEELWDISGYPMTLQGTTRNPWSTRPCLYKIPQGIPRVLCHVYIRYHKESLEYSAISI